MKAFAIFLFLIPVSINAQTALEIIQSADEYLRGESSIAEISIEVQRPSWSRNMSIKAWAKGTELSLILIQSPARDKGTVFLKRQKEIWNWQPQIERIIKLPPSMMMQSWMGSDFTNDDLVKESSIIEDYKHKLLGDTIILDRNCYIIELTPKPEAPVVWGKIISFIGKDLPLQMGSEFYDEENYLINKMNIVALDYFGGKLLPSLMEMIPMEEENQKTIMQYHSLEFNTKIDDTFFSKQNMKRLR